MPAAVLIGAAVVGAGATIYASNKASSATNRASNAAIKAQQDALQQQKELSAPYRKLGEDAIPTLENLLGVGKGGMAGAEKTLQNMPGYQFAKKEGVDATKAAAGSMGLALSGNTLKGIDQFSTGLADQTYGSEVNNLLSLTRMGQAAAAGQAANVGQAATNTGNIAIGQGNNIAGIQANEAASLAGIAGNAAGQYETSQFLDKLNVNSDPSAVASTGRTAEMTVGSPGAPTLGGSDMLGATTPSYYPPIG